MTIDHPDNPNVALTDEEDLPAGPRRPRLIFAATGSSCSTPSSNGSRVSGSCGSRPSSCQSSDCASEGASPPPVPPRPPETLSCESTPPDSPLDAWHTFPLPNRQPIGRHSSWQTLKPELERLNQLQRFSAGRHSVSSSTLPHVPLRSCKSAAAAGRRSPPRSSGKVSRTLSEGAIKLKQSLSSFFHRKSSKGKDSTSSAASTCDVEDVEELERYREKLIHDLFPNSGEIQFVKGDEPPPPLPPRNWETVLTDRTLPPRNCHKNKRARETHRWGGSFSS